jgi:hypothetical protein
MNSINTMTHSGNHDVKKVYLQFTSTSFELSIPQSSQFKLLPSINDTDNIHNNIYTAKVS